ncbi:MAG TPA: methyltransferase domain-containing protein, partial [Puia sp.]
CGTGELTKILADKFAESKVLGIDTSAEMLAKAPLQDNLSFSRISIQKQIELNVKWDLILANASLQWINDHQELFPAMIARLSGDGQLAVQMPSQKENLLNQILFELVHEPPYFEKLSGVIRQSPILSLDEYTFLLIRSGAKQVVIYQKVYPLITQSIDSLYEFIAGSALIPYMEKLDENMKSEFEKEFRYRISKSFPSSPFIYAFKRLILVGQF